jgi:hypothetical protein
MLRLFAWNTIPCSVVYRYQCFEGNSRFRLQLGTARLSGIWHAIKHYTMQHPRSLCHYMSLEERKLRRMPSSGMLHCVALVRTDVSEELSASIIIHRLLVTANVVPSSPILVTLIMEELSSSLTSVITSSTRRNIPENGILHKHRRENLKSYKGNSVLRSKICL